MHRRSQRLLHYLAKLSLQRSPATNQPTNGITGVGTHHTREQTMSRDVELQGYFRESASWDADRVGLAERSARRARVLAMLATVLAALAILAITTLLPLKTVQPYLIRVDNTTGSVDTVPAYLGGAPLDTTITRFLLTHYVTVCERFNFATAEQDYSECGAFHSPKRNQQWAASWTLTNPDSPLNRYKDGSTLRVDVQSLSFFERGSGLNDLAQIRYTQHRRNPDGGEVSTTAWIATLQYAYVTPSADPNLRRWNPLGFRIVEFRPERESSGAAPNPTTATPVTVAVTTPAGQP
jgi:type IV secretion system protein VirB8